jgi:putative two-component system response regulator
MSLSHQALLDKFLHTAKVLIVDDNPVNVSLLKDNLERWGYFNSQTTTDAREVPALYVQFAPDIILLDLMMPHLDGFQVMEKLRPLIPQGDYLPILMLTADATPQVRKKALSAGAKDFLTKPFDAEELLLRVCNLLEARFYYLQVKNQNRILEVKVHERTQMLEQSQLETLERLARAAEFRDDDTGQHTYRVGHLSALLAEGLGLAEHRVEAIRRAAPLHDIGKIGIPDHILLKPGRLTPEEFDLIKTHTTIGAALLQESQSALARLAERIALTHHERWDGTGYPHRLKGEEIPIEGRIVAIVDVFDALTHERPYKKAWPVEAAIAEIKSQSGRQFDPAVVKAFLTLPFNELAYARNTILNHDNSRQPHMIARYHRSL